MELVTKIVTRLGVFPDCCVSVVTAETRTAHISEMQQELALLQKSLEFPHRCVCILHIA